MHRVNYWGYKGSSVMSVGVGIGVERFCDNVHRLWGTVKIVEVPWFLGKVSVDCIGLMRCKGPYPFDYIGVMSGRIGCRQPILSPILLLIPLWVWPIYWAIGQWPTTVDGRLGNRRLLSSMFDISIPTCQFSWNRH